MARVKNSEKLETVAGAVTPGTKIAIENYRWDAHKTQSQVIREAVEYFLAGRKIEVTEPAADVAPVEAQAAPVATTPHTSSPKA